MNCGALAIASTVVVGVASTQIELVDLSAAPSVVVISPVGFVAVPTASSPVVPELGEAETEALGLTEELGLPEAEGLSEALDDEDGETEPDGLLDIEDDGLAEAEGLTEALGEPLVEAEGLTEDDGLPEILADDDGDREDDGLPELEGLTEALGELEAELELDGLTEALGEREVAVSELVTFPKTLTKTAPVTVKSVLVPTAPVLTPSKAKLLTAQIDQSGDVTGALSAFRCAIFLFSFYSVFTLAHIYENQTPAFRTLNIAWLKSISVPVDQVTLMSAAYLPLEGKSPAWAR